MTSTTPRIAELSAPASWRVVDFISDLHLQAEEPETVQAWQAYMAGTTADAVFILGDLFEAWIGDDGLAVAAPPAASPEAFEQACVRTLRAASDRRALYILHGNRDFLIGPGFVQASGTTLLDDPTVLAFAGQRWLLSHGDALCLDDVEYQRFRHQVRSPAWQQAFLAQPLAQRRAIARQLREQSKARQHGDLPYADADPALMLAWLQAAGAHCLIHGHTHRPADHTLADGRQRRVLSDWDAAAQPARTEVLRLIRPAADGPVRVLRLRSEEAR